MGSNLGQVLFLVFINDLPDIVLSTVKLFADVTKMYRPIWDIQDQEIIQQDLDNLYRWSQVWQLPFSVEKCKVLHIGNNNNNKVYSLNSRNLQQVLEEKDLGVTFERLQFSTQQLVHQKQTNDLGYCVEILNFWMKKPSYPFIRHW